MVGIERLTTTEIYSVQNYVIPDSLKFQTYVKQTLGTHN